MIEIPAKAGCEERSANAMKRKYFLCQPLVLGQVHGVGTRASVEPTKEIEISSEVHLHGVVSGVRLDQVEEQIGIRAGEGDQGLLVTIEGVVTRFVTQAFERFEDFFPVVLLSLFALFSFFPLLLYGRLRGFILVSPGLVENGDFKFFIHIFNRHLCSNLPRMM